MTDRVMTEDSLLESFLTFCHRRRYSARAQIVSPGDPADTLYYVAEGSLSIIYEDEEGKEVVLAYINQGEFMGEVGLFVPLETRNVYVKTRSKCQLAEISYTRLQQVLDRELVEDKANFLHMMGVQLAQRLMHAERKMSDLALLDVTGRIAHALLDMSTHPDVVTHPEGLLVKATRTELAKITGCSREMAGRCLKDLENKGLIKSIGQSIVVISLQDQSVE